MGCSPFTRPMCRRDTPDEATNDWRARMRADRTYGSEGGEGPPFPTSIEGYWGCPMPRRTSGIR
jgi:hypothetical protein